MGIMRHVRALLEVLHGTDKRRWDGEDGCDKIWWVWGKKEPVATPTAVEDRGPF